MYFDPLSVKRIRHQSTSDANMRPDSGKTDLISETLARGLGVGLSYREFAGNFEHQVAAFCTNVSGIQQILKLRICIAPTALAALVLL